jgi:hypothetical protein
MTTRMMRTLASLLLLVGVGLPAVATADDPVERAAEKAANAKKDNKPKADRPQEEPTQANRREAGNDKPLVEPKAAHGDKLAPIQAGAQAGARVHKKHHHGVDTDKWMHDPTDADRH